MQSQDDRLQTLHEIRSIMDRSGRFQSLSGLSGIFVGLLALASAGAVQWHLAVRQLDYAALYQKDLPVETARFVASAAIVVFAIATCAVLYFTMLKARKARQSVWTPQSRRLLLNFCLPMAVGGAFCGVLLYHDIKYLVAPAMLMFYGLALANASKYAFADLRSLGTFELVLGLVSGLKIEYGLLAWTLGFGMLHVFYGSVIYYKYEKYND